MFLDTQIIRFFFGNDFLCHVRSVLFKDDILIF
jgi:hypothetical protein